MYCSEVNLGAMTSEQAEIISLQCLGWLVANDDLLPVFLGSSGASEEDLKNYAAEPEFLGSVLDFLMMDDAWVVSFCDSAGIRYDIPAQARMALPGGSHMHWT
jgi:Protein of unknown function (DUF3572)